MEQYLERSGWNFGESVVSMLVVKKRIYLGVIIYLKFAVVFLNSIISTQEQQIQRLGYLVFNSLLFPFYRLCVLKKSFSASKAAYFQTNKTNTLIFPFFSIAVIRPTVQYDLRSTIVMEKVIPLILIWIHRFACAQKQQHLKFYQEWRILIPFTLFAFWDITAKTKRKQ